jgi:hypothetical protein
MNNQKGDRREMVDLENMHVRDLIVYYLKTKNVSTEGLEDGYYTLGDVPPNIQYWKIAPGDNAWNWEACLQGGYSAIGWAELGDISVLPQEDFNKQRDKIITQHPDWTKTALDQVWKFAHIPERSVIVANRGTTAVLGFGRVTGGYYFMQGEGTDTVCLSTGTIPMYET